MSKYAITSGTIAAPVKTVLYGPEGIGKSTFAAQFPAPVFIDTEGGTKRLNVARLPAPTSWAMLLDEVAEVSRGNVPCGTLVIDTADWAERLCIDAVCARAKVKGIEDFGYGKGYTYAKEEFGKLLDALEEVLNTGHNVVVLAHSPQNPELCFERMSNISLDAPNVVVRIGRSGVDTSIHNSQIVCKKIIWDTSHLLIEAKNPTGCSICTKDVSSGNSPRIEIVCAEKLNISMPDITHYYKFLPFKYEFEDPNSIDILKFTHALRCILVEFRTHSKDTLAKHIERIDNVVVGSNPIKQKVLAFMKDTGIIYEESHLYKVNPAKMQECKISFIGLSNMNFGQLEEGYEKFKAWESSLH